MSTKRTQILAIRVIHQMLADRRTLALMGVVPVVLLSFLGILIRADPSRPVVGIVNNDAGMSLAGGNINLGERLTGVLYDIGEFNTEPMTTSQAREKLDDGKVDVVITIPSDFTSQVWNTRKLALTVEFEGSNPMMSDRLKKLLDRVALQSVNTLALTGAPALNLPAGTASGDTGIETTIEATYLHSGPDYDTLDFMAPALIGFFVFFLVFILTCISFLRERLAGTLERLQATPIRPTEIIVGYMGGFLVFGLVQGAVTLLYTVFVLNVHYAGNLLNIFIVEMLLVAVSVNLGIFLSTFAQNEFQVLQFIPLVVVSQGLLGGVVWQVEDMPTWLQPIARLMPLTYGTRALREIMIKGETLIDVADSLLVLAAFAVAVVFLSARTAGRARI